MTCTEEYKEHIEYTFHAFCKVVIRNAMCTAARARSRKYKREISLEYLTEEKYTPLGTNDKCFQAPDPDTNQLKIRAAVSRFPYYNENPNNKLDVENIPYFPLQDSKENDNLIIKYGISCLYNSYFNFFRKELLDQWIITKRIFLPY